MARQNLSQSLGENTGGFLANDTRILNDVLQNFEMMKPLQLQAYYSRIGGGIPPGRLGGIFVGQRHRQQLSRCDMKGNIQRFCLGSICSGTIENREDAKGRIAMIFNVLFGMAPQSCK